MGVIVKNTILEDVLACHNKGWNNQGIANNFGISSVKVRKLLITAGITFTSKTYELVTAMHKRGYSAAEIAAKCNLISNGTAKIVNVRKRHEMISKLFEGIIKYSD